MQASHYQHYKWHLHRTLVIYVACLLGFVGLMGLAERAGLSRQWIGGIFLLTTVILYAAIGIYNRTSDANQYFVAGRTVPAMYNGMATAADWMSAASYISLAGGLYLQGFAGTATEPGGMAYILGWTGGFCLVALLVAPYLRRMEIYTVPDYFDKRYGGRWPRLLAAMAAIIVSFTYVVAQIYGVGLITARVTGVRFEIGILLGLGGVLVCSFLGGMRAVTWTQVAQYVIMILAFLIPVSWLSYQQLGNPLAPLMYGQQLPKITALEKSIMASPAEQQVVDIYAARAQHYADKLQDVPATLARERKQAQEKLRRLNDERADASTIFAANRELVALPRDAATAREKWTHRMEDNQQRAKPLGGMPPHTQAFEGDPDGSPAERQLFNTSRLNFLALMLCLMVGTAGLPHLLTRYYTTPTVGEARQSVAWSLLFISLIYISAPALAVLVKYEVLSHLVGQNFDALPQWIAQWTKVDPSLVSVSDVNGDHIVQLGEIHFGADIIMLATPEIGGMPYIVSGLVAAGGLAAALSTADGLLLTIGNAIAHDMFPRAKPTPANTLRRVMTSKLALLLVAVAAAYAAAQKPADILYLVSASFSLAGAAFFPAMVLGIFWPRASRAGAISGILVGLGVTLTYMAINANWILAWFGMEPQPHLWWGIQPIAAGVFGVPAGMAAVAFISLVIPDRPAQISTL